MGGRVGERVQTCAPCKKGVVELGHCLRCHLGFGQAYKLSKHQCEKVAGERELREKVASSCRWKKMKERK